MKTKSKRKPQKTRGPNFIEACLMILPDIGSNYGLCPDHAMGELFEFAICLLAKNMKTKRAFNNAVKEILKERNFNLK